jgi:hypothetical protein
MASAFQSDAFQINAFQISEIVPRSSFGLSRINYIELRPKTSQVQERLRVECGLARPNTSQPASRLRVKPAKSRNRVNIVERM